MRTLSASQSNNLRLKAQEVCAKRAESSMELAEILHTTYWAEAKVGNAPVPVWHAWGYSSWADYVETELGYHMSTANSYRRIHEVFGVQLAGKWERNLLVSFTRMRQLCRVVDKTNVNSWLRRAAKMTCCELDAVVYEVLTGHVRPKNMRSFLASVTNQELKALNEVINIGREDFQTMRRGEVLTAIINEWRTIREAKTRTTRRLQLVG